MSYRSMLSHQYERGGDNYLLLLALHHSDGTYHLYWLKNGKVMARANLGTEEESALITYRQEVRNSQENDI